MEKSKKRRVTQKGPKKRMWITLEQDTFETLQASGEKLGYSLSALVHRVIDRGVRAGLTEKETPSPHGADVVSLTQFENREQIDAEVNRLHEKHTTLLLAKIEYLHEWIAALRMESATKSAHIAKLEQRLGDYAKTITEQAPT